MLDFVLETFAELDGYEAYVAGEEPTANPYALGSENHAAWARGWEEAEFDCAG